MYLDEVLYSTRQTVLSDDGSSKTKKKRFRSDLIGFCTYNFLILNHLCDFFFVL